MGQIGLAFHNYEAVHGHLPPVVVYGADGRPLHSWRVLLLPFLEEEQLYKEFRLDEAWDSEHNQKHLPRMPKSYRAPWTRRVDVQPDHTVYHVLVGPGTAFERPGLRLSADFPDGLSDTLMFVEAGNPVPWTKPEEIAFDPGEPLRLRGLFRNGFRACTAGGSYRFIPDDTDEAELRACITRNGAEPRPARMSPVR